MRRRRPPRARGRPPRPGQAREASHRQGREPCGDRVTVRPCGVTLARRSIAPGTTLPLVSAIAGTAVAVAVVIAAAGGTASLHRVLDEPERFGAPWDAFVGAVETAEDEEVIGQRVAAVGEVDAAAMIPGSPVSIDGDELWLMAFVPIDGVDPIEPPIISGRAPTADDEIALGTVVARRAHAGIGDEVQVDSGVAAAGGTSFRVVGMAMVYDGYEPHVGIGALVAPAGLERAAPEATGSAVVRVVGGADRNGALRSVEEAFPDSFQPVRPPASLRNAERIAILPMFVGIGTVLVAGLTLTHALAVSVRRQRPQLAVCRVLGFTPLQVRGVLCTEATLLALVASVGGVLLGVIGAQQGWHLVAEGLGLASDGAQVSVWLVAGGILGVLGLANVVVALLGTRVVRLHPASALRTE